jgi:hypothetical protein
MKPMETKKQTAVEWLVEELEQHHTKIDIKNTVVFQQAKAMERNQIMIAHYVGSSPRIIHNNSIHYYSETYGQ